jgi:hypothetical protein
VHRHEFRDARQSRKGCPPYIPTDYCYLFEVSIHTRHVYLYVFRMFVPNHFSQVIILQCFKDKIDQNGISMCAFYNRNECKDESRIVILISYVT